MSVRGWSRAAKAHIENKDQPQLTTAAKIAELRQVVQQQAELMQKQAEEARDKEEELISYQNQLFEAFMQRFPIFQGKNRPGLVVEYMRQFDQSPQYAPDMVQTETKEVCRFLSRLCPGLVGSVDAEKNGPQSYTDAVRCAIWQESWTEIEKNVNLGTSNGLKEVLQLGSLQVVGNQRGGRRFGFQSRKPKKQVRSDGTGGRSQAKGKRKGGLENHGQPGQFEGSKQA